MPSLRSSLVCSGCGASVVADEPWPFRCPNARPGDDVEHVLRRRLEVAEEERARLEAAFSSAEPNPFLRYRELFHVHSAALGRGVSDADYQALVNELDRRVAETAGVGFHETPFARQPGLARELGCEEVWVKDETGNVGGTHKGRHLAAVMIWLLIEERLRGGAPGERSPLAISSCGNAAWAATLLAESVDWPIEVYVPPDAGEILDRLAARGAGLRRCERRPSEKGDPCYLRFSEALEAGSVPFTCQGPANGLVIEGGQTLIWEVVSTLLREERALDRLFIQTGGGALASACVLGWREARLVVDIGRLPTLHPVQTTASAPLVRAYDAIVERLAGRLGATGDRPGSVGERAELAARLRARLDPELIQEELHYAAGHRSEFMWPWEEPSHSVADAILDDETYDWLPLISAMLESGGYPVVASEERLVEANRLALEATEISVSVSGSAGLAGALELTGAGLLRSMDRVGLLFSGVREAGNQR